MTDDEWARLKGRALDLAEVIDAHRIFPKSFVYGYGVLCWHIAIWYEGLKDPSAQQATFVTVVVSVFAPLFNWYAQGGRRWGKKDEADA